MEYRIRQVKFGGRRWRDAGKFYLINRCPGLDGKMTGWSECGPPCDTREECFRSFALREPRAAAEWKDRLLSVKV